MADFIQASPLKLGFELSQTVDFKKGVTFCDNSICVQPGAPNENIVQNHLNIALLNVF